MEIKVIKPYAQLQLPSNFDYIETMERIEKAGRICYNSVAKDYESTKLFIKKLIDSGHYSVLEHENFTVKFVCDRGVSHELVRHRLAAYSQQSTRYCDYNNEMTFIKPSFYEEGSPEYVLWYDAMKNAAISYCLLRNSNSSPQKARSVLPNSLKTEIFMTTNIREWRHVLNLRCSKAAHPQIRELMLDLLYQFNDILPVIFGDLNEKYNGEMK